MPVVITSTSPFLNKAMRLVTVLSLQLDVVVSKLVFELWSWDVYVWQASGDCVSFLSGGEKKVELKYKALS